MMWLDGDMILVFNFLRSFRTVEGDVILVDGGEAESLDNPLVAQHDSIRSSLGARSDISVSVAVSPSAGF